MQQKFFPATQKNKWGGVTNGMIRLGGNRPVGSNPLSPVERMYTVYTMPYAGIWPPPDVEVDLSQFYIFGQAEFVNTLITFGIFFCYFFWIMEKHLDENLNYRLDRIETFLVTRVMSGTDKNILATLFGSYMLTENNVEFRRNLYYATICCKIALLTPIIVLWAWGLSTAGSCNPPAVGFAILFIGTALILSWYGLKLWRLNGWRMSTTTLNCLGGR